jgi:transcriptional regulator with XRE-family HTH domain
MKHKHWTEESTAAFAYRIASDFVEQLEQKRKSLNWRKRRLARELGLSPGRVSQLINDPGNLTLELMVKVARALQMKVSVLAYEDGDQENYRGPINAEIFRSCWEIVGKPNGKLDLDQVHLAATIDNMFEQYVRVGDKLLPMSFAPAATQHESITGESIYGGADTNCFQLPGIGRSASTACESNEGTLGDFHKVRA